MRYLIHSDDCDYAAATGIYTIALDARLWNPVNLKLMNIVFEAPTLSAYPLAVYCHSVGINDLIRSKHTLKLTAENHENETDVIAVLSEDQTSGRFRLRQTRRFALNPTTCVRSFDFRFTDNNTIVGGGGGSTDFDEVEDDMALPSGTTKTGVIFRAFDTGGRAGNYGDNENLNRIYETTNGTNWKIRILAFTTESGYDMLSIVEIDEADAETTILDAHSGGMPGTVNYTATQKKIKFVWISDGSNNDVGFDILLWEDDDGANTLNGPSDGSYSVTIPGSSSKGKFVVEMDIISAH